MVFLILSGYSFTGFDRDAKSVAKTSVSASFAD
jgi:hypothetical protein